jgi:hypothetical protein
LIWCSVLQLEGFVSSELEAHGLSGAEHTGHPTRLAIFSACFDRFVEESSAYKPLVSQHGWLLSRRGCSLPASASGLDTHRDAITRRFGTQLAKIQAEFGAGIAQLRQQLEALLPTQTRLATLEAAQDQETHELRAGFFRETHGLREGMYPPR